MANILIVENDRIIARDLASIVEALGHQVAGVGHSFSEAIVLIEEAKPDLALLDIHIDGDRDGVAVAGELREEHSLALAFITSHADHETVMRASIVRPNGYLVKPFDEKSVDALINVALANFSQVEHTLNSKGISQPSDADNRALSAARLQSVEDYISRRLDRPIKVEELAKLCGLSAAEFSRQFQAATGSSPYKYLSEERLKEAKRLLRNTQWSLVEIALAVGFGNQSHFTAAFRKTFGTTPSAYRRFTR